MSDDYCPIDFAETFAEDHGISFDRMNDDQIAMGIERQWRTYSVTLARSHYDDTLRLLLTFEMEPPEGRYPALYEMLNLVNDQCWFGVFTFWQEQQLMVYRYGLLTDEEGVSAENVETMIETAVNTAEQYYPAIQLVMWSEMAPAAALKAAIAQAYGRA